MKNIGERLIASVGGMYSRGLGINLSVAKRGEVFKWFLAAKLYGARISSMLAERTYREFEQRGVLTPEAVQGAGLDVLVKILGAGGYARYDYSTATRLLSIMDNLVKDYRGDLNALHGAAADARDLERRLMRLGKGIGGVTVNVFLRELRGVWPKARPALSPLAVLAAGHGHLGLLPAGGEPLEFLERAWGTGSKGFGFRDFEAALVRLGKDYCKRGLRAGCPMNEICLKAG